MSTAERRSTPGSPRVWAWSLSNPVVLDALWVGPFALLCVATTLTDVYPGAVLAVVTLVQVGALVVRRTRPVTSVAIVFVTGLAQWALVLPGSEGSGYLFRLSYPAVLVAQYSIAAHGPRWARWAALGGGALGAVLLGSAVVIAAPSGQLGLEGLVAAAATTGVSFVLCLLAWTGGQLRRVRLEQQAATAEAARRRQGEMEQRVLVAAAQERARIARDLHDVVAHSLSVVIAQADGGRYAAASDPTAAITALETVAATGRGALTDMRRLLGVLREGPDAGGATGDAAPMAPQPGEQDITALVESVRASGLDVALTQVGEPRPVPAGAGLALYRGVQESLTNVLKHAGPGARARVQVAWRPDAVEVRVEDDGGSGPTVPTSGDGHGQGLTGMRERLTMFGGTVDAGPLPGGGFGTRLVLSHGRAAPPGPSPSEPAQPATTQPATTHTATRPLETHR